MVPRRDQYEAVLPRSHCVVTGVGDNDTSVPTTTEDWRHTRPGPLPVDGGWAHGNGSVKGDGPRGKGTGRSVGRRFTWVPSGEGAG